MVIALPSSIPAPVAQFIKHLYALSDQESKHVEYSQLFSSSGLKFRIGPIKTIEQPEGIVEYRKGRYVTIKTREHSVHDCFVHPDRPTEYMLRGEVHIDFKDGTKGANSFGSWMVFEEDPTKVEKWEDLKVKTYTVWSVPKEQ